ncbi:MAG: hypothetical protein A7316_10030 [Candidatus Altiarchaeales archaeon WOR_SM1_86-2]|nr:MAG: hypothetical protein A7316_10030 [Candidatus Altiarchaeales archaeon WOR_SM1_86-2]
MTIIRYLNIKININKKTNFFKTDKMKYIEDRKVGELMTHGAITVPEHAKVIDVVRILSDDRIHAVVVVDKEHRASGVISEIDISKALGCDLGEVTAVDIMSNPVKSIDANASVGEAAKVMAENRFERLAILGENGLPTGVISMTDIIREIAMSGF